MAFLDFSACKTEAQVISVVLQVLSSWSVFYVWSVMKQAKKTTFVNYIYDLGVQKRIQVPMDYLKVMIGFSFEIDFFYFLFQLIKLFFTSENLPCSSWGKKVNRYIETFWQITYINKEMKIDTFLTDFSLW